MNFLSSSTNAAQAASAPFDHSALAFSTAEPGDDQRWSTWPATTPSERGPEPRPDWVVTSAGAIDTELGVVKSGKEAELFLIERAVPDATPAPGTGVVLAAKRYRSSEHSDFHRSTVYTEGRRTRRSRDARAIAKGTSYGRSFAATRWAIAEFDALCGLYELGAAVPYPVQVHETEVLMEFIGEGRVAAPRLAEIRAGREALRPLFEQLVDTMHRFAQAGLAHGDLSPYNVLVQGERLVVIDVPQIVDVVANPNGLELLHRDAVNICTWFTRRGLECDAEELFAELVADIRWA